MTRVSSGSPFEGVIGFSRAVRSGPWITVAGTAPIGAEAEDVYGQTRRCLAIMTRAIEDAGGSVEQVVRTRVMLVDITTWQDAARAHGEVFAQIRPACTFVGVTRFIDPAWRVEIEADVFVT